ncbi:Flp family type IVb pilin [Novosphingobium tardum]|uniref:Flp family type IVb pilin n=1 Tax=Novosphingobium tardum TaxID=1538021 RepID=A0ABV8RJW4_9SPHN
MKTFLKSFLADESGASAAEYALILAVVGVAIGAAALTLGQNVGLSINKAAVTVGTCGKKANGTAATTYATTVPATC